MYKADVSPLAAMDGLQQSPYARLIDVRTADEWAEVGGPSVDGLMAVEWLTMPMGEINPNFLDEVERGRSVQGRQSLHSVPHRAALGCRCTGTSSCWLHQCVQRSGRL